MLVRIFIALKELYSSRPFWPYLPATLLGAAYLLSGAWAVIMLLQIISENIIAWLVRRDSLDRAADEEKRRIALEDRLRT